MSGDFRLFPCQYLSISACPPFFLSVYFSASRVLSPRTTCNLGSLPETVLNRFSFFEKYQINLVTQYDRIDHDISFESNHVFSTACLLPRFRHPSVAALHHPPSLVSVLTLPFSVEPEQVNLSLICVVDDDVSRSSSGPHAATDRRSFG